VYLITILCVVDTCAINKEITCVSLQCLAVDCLLDILMSLNYYSRSLGNHGDFLQEAIIFSLSQFLIQSLNSFSSRSILSKIYRGAVSVFVLLTSLCGKFRYE